jgi:murein DD-endopeptidase MepM/ murein hydrolase activator NlpD
MSVLPDDPQRGDTSPLDAIHRPLPSVDIPLLREERRALRSRHLVAWTMVVIVTVAGAAAFAWVRSMGPAEPAVPATPEATASAPAAGEAPSPSANGAVDDGLPPAAPSPSPAEVVGATNEPESTTPTVLGAMERKSQAFGRARSFHAALLGIGIPEDVSERIEGALVNIMNFRHCHPEDRLVVERDDTGAVLLFEYHAVQTEFFRAKRDAKGGFVGEKVDVPVDRTRIRAGGTVQSSLGDALSRVGLGRSLVGVFVAALQRNVDFSKQTRAGDSFRLIVDDERVNGQFLGYGTVHAVEYDGQRTGKQRAYWYEPQNGEGDYYDETGRALHGGWLRAPLHYDHLSSGFNLKRKHPILKRIMPHNGVDYSAGTGTPVWAAADGVVTFAGKKGPNGNLVSIRHEGGYETHYAHLSSFQAGIKSGVKVKQRQVIGAVGSTGRSTGPHLHFGLERHGRFVDPVPIINGPGALLPPAQLSRFKTTMRRLASELERIPVAGSGAPMAAPAPEVPQSEDSADSPMD